jgi:hypothetical protein
VNGRLKEKTFPKRAPGNMQGQCEDVPDMDAYPKYPMNFPKNAEPQYEASEWGWTENEKTHNQKGLDEQQKKGGK